MPSVNREDGHDYGEHPEENDRNIERGPPNAHFPQHDTLGHPGDESDKKAKIEEYLFFKRDPLERKPREKNRDAEEQQRENGRYHEIEYF